MSDALPAHVSIIDMLPEIATEYRLRADNSDREPCPENWDAPVRLEHVSGKSGGYVGHYRLCRGEGLLAGLRCSEHVAQQIVTALRLVPHLCYYRDNLPPEIQKLLPKTHEPGESAHAEKD